MLDVLLLLVSGTVVYANLNKLIPDYLSKQRYSIYFSFLIPILISAGFIFSAILSLIGDLSKIDEWERYFSFKGWFTSTVFITMIVLITTFLKFIKEWFDQQRSTAELEKTKLRSELNFLKNQINPGFLFNSLDELQELAEKGSDRAPEMVLKLSEVLRYILYDGSKPKVSLQNEMNFLKTYVELEKMRLDGKHRDSVKFEVKLSDENYDIYPLIILPYISEAFKSYQTKNGSHVPLDISVDQQENNLHLQINEFTLDKEVKPNSEMNIFEKANQRLEWLYPDKYDIDLVKSNKKTTLNLTVELT